MVKPRHVLSLFAAASAGMLAAPAQAAVGAGAMPLAFAALALPAQDSCASLIVPANGLAAATQPVPLGKASAILGGQVSQLELMRQQQQGAAAIAAKPLTRFADATLPGAGLVPRLGGLDCAKLVLPAPGLSGMRAGQGHATLGPDDFLASKRLAVRKTSFDGNWNRVSRARLGGTTTAALRQMAPGAPGRSMLAAVNSWTNQRIRYVEDRELYGRADYWADARQTLKKRAGDCEDIAIAKMQLLGAMGVPASDMYLTIARDLVRNADHAVLVVRMGGSMHLLDNATDALLDAGAAHDYRPILSFSEGRKYLHGY